jgi:hypothetical protein
MVTIKPVKANFPALGVQDKACGEPILDLDAASIRNLTVSLRTRTNSQVLLQSTLILVIEKDHLPIDAVTFHTDMGRVLEYHSSGLSLSTILSSRLITSSLRASVLQIPFSYRFQYRASRSGDFFV